MAYPRAHARITWFGDAYNAQEIWQTGVRIDGTTVPDSTQMAALAAAFVTNLWTTTTGSPGSHRLLGVKWGPQDVNGEYGPDGEAVEYFLPTADPGSGTVAYPQIAIVISLRTARARGYASNGRMYLPTLLEPAIDGRITTTSALAVATAGAAFVEDVNAVGLGDVAVMSSVGAGRIEPVLGVRVGRVIDTQRRRRNGLSEEYTAEVAVPS